MRRTRSTNTTAFTLVEVCIAMGVLAMLAGVLFSTGVFVMRMVRFNMVAAEARVLGLQKFEEVVGGGAHNIILQTPFPVQTNLIQTIYPIYRTVDVIGHATNLTQVTDLMASDFLEVHVNVIFDSPMKGHRRITNSFSTLVLQ
jgi:hypothetical protein